MLSIKRFLAAALLAIGLAACAGQGEEAKGPIIVSQHASIGGASIPFETTGPWVLSYAMRGTAVAVHLVDEATGSRTILVASSGSGQIRRQDVGKFRLDVATDGSWTLVVREATP